MATHVICMCDCDFLAFLNVFLLHFVHIQFFCQAAGGGFGGGGVVSGRLAADQEISFAGGAGGSRSRVHFDDQR